MPDQRVLLDHQPTVTAAVGKGGGPTYAHRGAVITSNDRGTLFTLCLDGLPGGWQGLGNLEAAVRIVNSWLDHGRLPAPYRTRGNGRAGEGGPGMTLPREP